MTFLLFVFALRVVSLSPSITEMLIDLGLENHIIGVCHYDSLRIKESVQDLGGWLDPNFEKMVKIKPDFVLLVDSQKGFVTQKLQKLGLNYRILPSKKLQDIFISLDSLAVWFGVEKRTQKLKDSLLAFVDSLKSERKQKIKTVIVIDHIPGKLSGIYVAGGNNYINDLLELAGFENLFKEISGYLNTDLESIIEKKPEIVIISGKNRNKGLWKSFFPCVFYIDPDVIAHPSTRFVKTLQKLLEIHKNALAQCSKN